MRALEDAAVDRLIDSTNNKRKHRPQSQKNNEQFFNLLDEVKNSRRYKKLEFLHNSIEIALAECILGLIELGPIGEKTLEMELLRELEKFICHRSSDRLKDIAQLGMDAVFKHNSHLLEHFISQSCKLHLYYNEFVVGSQDTIQTMTENQNSNRKRKRSSRNDKNITLVSLAYLTSLVSNFQSNTIGLSPISALVLCMLHQCSPHQQARNLALKLAECMATGTCKSKEDKLQKHYKSKKRKKGKMDYRFYPGPNFAFKTTTSSPDKYLKFAFVYSEKNQFIATRDCAANNV